MNRVVLTQHALERLRERFDWEDATMDDLAYAFYQSEPAPEWIRDRVHAGHMGSAVTVYGDAVFVSNFSPSAVIVATVLPLSWVRNNRAKC